MSAPPPASGQPTDITSTPNRGSQDGDYAVRIGTTGTIFRMTAEEVLRRGAQVVCRSPRGLEAGCILAPVIHADRETTEVQGRILRRMTPEDHLLWANLRSTAEEAHRACEALLERIGSSAVLLEVEPLLDGRTLYFHFLNEVDPALEQQLDQLIDTYQQTVAASQFAKLLEHGCGPGCGTEQATRGCGTSGGCVVCKVASACSTRKKT
jgi:hypothetical protein